MLNVGDSPSYHFSHSNEFISWSLNGHKDTIIYFIYTERLDSKSLLIKDWHKKNKDSLK